ncbi:hypothetical protein MTO96_007920 [Rhipicephalus appendiculatus]
MRDRWDGHVAGDSSDHVRDTRRRALSFLFISRMRWRWCEPIALSGSLMHIDAASKKRAARASLSDIEGGGFVTTGGPDSAYWYHQHSQWARTSAFKPWSPVLLKERMAAGKLPLGEQLLAGLPPLPVYLKHK